MSYCINPKCPNPRDPLNANNRICRHCGAELLIAGRYRVTKLLGEGGFAKTFEVDDRGFSKVLKVLHLEEPKAISLFQQESQVLQKLKHPGIPRVEPHGYFTLRFPSSSTPLHCLVMQKIYGQNLEQWLSDRDNYPISQTQAIDWLKQMTDILQEVHRMQFFHRDIKPTNIMLQPNGQLALIDFGSVREVTGTYLAKMGVGQRGTVITSKGYAPPEQENGHPVPQSDFFALARTFVHLLTGKHPLDFYDPRTDTLQWRKGAVKISPLLADFIDYLMERLPGSRPQSANVILQRLTELEASLQGQARLSLSFYQWSAKFEKFKKQGVAVGVLLLVGFIGYLEVRIYKYVSGNLAASSETDSPSVSPQIVEETEPSQIDGEAAAENVRMASVQSASFSSAMLNLTPTAKSAGESETEPVQSENRAIAQKKISELSELADQNISLYKTLSGHQKDVKSVAITPDSQKIVSGSFDGTIKIWNLKTGELIQTLTGHSEVGENISSIAISPDGRTLVSSSDSYGSTIKIWDLSTGFLLYTLKGQGFGVSVVAISPDSKRLASGGDDGSITLWNLENGQQLGKFSGNFVPVFSVEFSANGELLASGAKDGSVYLWNLSKIKGKVEFDLQPERRLLGHLEPVHSVAFSPNSQRLATGSADKMIKVWNVETGNAISTFSGNSGSILSVAISPNGQILAGGLFGRIKLWNLNTGKLIDTLSAHSLWVESVVFSPDGNILASGSSDRTVKIWGLE